MGATLHSLRPLPEHRVCRASFVLPGRPRPTARATVARRKTSIRYRAPSGARAMIVALLNQRHGVGKRTLALHPAGLWSYRTRHVTVIDADPQGRTLEWSEMRAQERLPRRFTVIGLTWNTLHRDAQNIACDVDRVIVDGLCHITALARGAADRGFGARTCSAAAVRPCGFRRDAQVRQRSEHVSAAKAVVTGRLAFEMAHSAAAVRKNCARGRSRKDGVMTTRDLKRTSMAHGCEADTSMHQPRANVSINAANAERCIGGPTIDTLPVLPGRIKIGSLERTIAAAEAPCGRSTNSTHHCAGGCSMTDLTHVDVLWFKKRIENWIRFGRIAEEKVVDRNRRSVSFAPGSIFALVRWASNDYGTVASRIDILRAVRPGERYSTVPYVRPGGEILLRLSGWPKVEKVLQAIDAVEALGIDPADAAPEHWHHIHNRLSVGEQPRPYTRSRHQAWLHRQKVSP